MSTRFKTNSTSLANSLFLLALVAGILHFELSGDEAASQGDQKVLHTIELVFRSAPPSGCQVLFVSKEVQDNDESADSRALSSSPYGLTFSGAFSAPPKTGQVCNRPFSSSRNFSISFNVPHQNSDEDELSILPVDVA